MHILLDHNADMLKLDRLNKWNFIDYCLHRHSLEFLFQWITSRKSEIADETIECLLNYCIFVFLFSSGCTRWQKTILENCFELGANPNLICCCGSTLIHLVKEDDEAECILANGFCLLNHRNKRGISPLMVLSVVLEAKETVASLIDRGANVDEVDNDGHTALHHVSAVSSSYLHCSEEFERRVNRLSKIRLLLTRSDEPTSKCYCRCLCCPGGCSPMLVMLNRTNFVGWNAEVYAWVLDYHIGLKSLDNQAAIDAALADLAWFRIFAELKVPHAKTCCSSYELIKCSHTCKRERSNRFTFFSSGAPEEQSRDSLKAIELRKASWQNERSSHDDTEVVEQLALLLKAMGATFREHRAESRSGITPQDPHHSARNITRSGPRERFLEILPEQDDYMVGPSIDGSWDHSCSAGSLSDFPSWAEWCYNQPQDPLATCGDKWWYEYRLRLFGALRKALGYSLIALLSTTLFSCNQSSSPPLALVQRILRHSIVLKRNECQVAARLC